MFVRCEIKPKKTLSSSGNAVVCDAFIDRFFYLSPTHAPIFHRSILPVLPPCCIQSNQNNQSDSGRPYPASCEFQPYVISRPLQDCPPKPAGDSTDDWATPMSAYRASSVNDPRGRTSWSTNAENRRRTCVKTAYAIQYSCCKRLVHLWKKDLSNNKFGEKCALSTPVDANPSIAIDWSSFETLPVAPEK